MDLGNKDYDKLNIEEIEIENKNILPEEDLIRNECRMNILSFLKVKNYLNKNKK